ncbi:MAG: DNA repair protein RecN [Bacteroidales bacterium]|nr:DNA repair protein RecN [Lentimicrobiaceae bacterium]MDD5695966.1 DNA repair protein RecN [Bacteroidales bacterium]
MLTHLSIRNYALIKELDIELSGGFLVITGETGAGKSILLGALSLILGQRADTTLLNEKDKKCIVEGSFLITHYALESFFQRNDLDWSETILLRREISPNGTSRAFINDTPVTLAVMKELGEKLVNIHSQYQTLTLNDASFHLTVVDNYAGILPQVANYRQRYDQLLQLRVTLDRLSHEETRSKSTIDYEQFIVDELEKAHLQNGEQEDIEKELQLLNNAEEIKSSLFTASQTVLHGDHAVLDQLRDVTNALLRSVRFYPDLQPMIDRLNEVDIEMKDLALEIDRLESKISHDPERIRVLSERIDLINRLEHKHQVKSIDELLDLKERIHLKIQSWQSLGEQIQHLQKEIDTLEEALNLVAEGISSKRHEVCSDLEKEVIKLLSDLGMPDARFVVEQIRLESLTRDGWDQVTFLFNANRGGEVREISGIASGGERSRLMLSLKSLIARKNLLPTIIFDEIDMGISGEVAGKMGTILRRMSEFMQVIVITHLPQIAGKAQSHYLVYKTADIFTSQTFLKKLTREERIMEIAKMLSDQQVTESAILAAKELMKHNL